MKFTHAQCTICLADIFDEKEIVTFRRPVERVVTRKPLERFDLEGEQPWCGVTCICLKCAQTIADAMIADRWDVMCGSCDHVFNLKRLDSCPSCGAGY